MTRAQALRELLERATKGPWCKPFEDGALSGPDQSKSLLGLDVDGMAICSRADDAALIVAMHEALPALLDVLEAEERRIAAIDAQDTGAAVEEGARVREALARFNGGKAGT